MSIKDETVARFKEITKHIDGKETLMLEYRADAERANIRMVNAKSSSRIIREEIEVMSADKLYLRGVLLALGFSEQQIDYEL